MKIETTHSTVYISTEIDKILLKVIDEYSNSKIFIMVDENTIKYCLPTLHNLERISSAQLISINSGESNKSIESVIKIWEFLKEKGADRNSLLINVGGGIICDMGGFAASTFKRGMNFINIPTTLLSQVDASVGGKTGVNFNGLKNEIGVFSNPDTVIIDSSFIKTLDKKNILSGWAEMLKHAIIYNESDWENLVQHDIKRVNFKELNTLIARSVSIKNHFVEKDPKEKNIRKALNFGHTFGHAFESFFMNSKDEILHGEAVAHGMICETYLSYKQLEFPESKLKKITSYLLGLFDKLNLDRISFEKLYEFMQHDKKNENAKINFTLLKDFGEIEINQDCTKENILDTLNWYYNL